MSLHRVHFNTVQGKLYYCTGYITGYNSLLYRVHSTASLGTIYYCTGHTRLLYMVHYIFVLRTLYYCTLHTAELYSVHCTTVLGTEYRVRCTVSRVRCNTVSYITVKDALHYCTG